MKKLLKIKTNTEQHWVGDGFPVRSIFSYNDLGKDISPFLLMDYAGPVEFKPSHSEHRPGVGEHPHRGFETVTIVFSGEVEHRDSAGGGGQIGPGDVQWMTAASGLVHEEKHGKEFSKNGGTFEMIQLWVNLPAKDKMTKPRYQGLRNADIPRISLGDDRGFLRVIAGEFRGTKGPALTHTAINLWDAQLKAGAKEELRLKAGHTSSIFVRKGSLKLGTGEVVSASTLAVLDSIKEEFSVQALEDVEFLILSGEPIREPIVGYGPFVMNSRTEIQQAFIDFQEGRMGSFAEVEDSEAVIV